MRNFNQMSVSEKSLVVRTILNAYKGLTEKGLLMLINKTDVGGVQFAFIKDYSSDATNNSETASQLINIGACYENMLIKDGKKLSDVNVNEIDVNDFNYSTVDMGGLSLENYKQAVKEALTVALAEMLLPKKSIDTSSTIVLTSALQFNTNTNNLLIKGMQIKKTVSVQGDFKVVKSAPKTIAKKLIEKHVKSSAAQLRTFKIDNICGQFNVNGNQLIFG